MKIRTVTVGVSLPAGDLDAAKALLSEAAAFAQRARAAYEAAGFEVQTTRVVTNPFEEFAEGLPALQALSAHAAELGVAFLNVGPATTEAGVRLVPELLRTCENVSCTALLRTAEGAPAVGDAAFAAAVADALLAVARETEGGFGSFRFGASTCRPGTPFFPAGYHASGAAPAFTVGLENSDVAVAAFARGRASVPAAAQALHDALAEALAPVEAVALALELEGSFAYGGIDTSLCPSLARGESLVDAFEALGMGPFGGPGTLAVCAAITAQLQALPVRRTGYCGLMLPPLEDAGLAERGAEGAYSVKDLLLYSTVCGIGLDCVPVAGDEPPARVAALLLDVAGLSAKWDKQLSCRLFPVPGKAVGERTEFENPYLCNTVVMSL